MKDTEFFNHTPHNILLTDFLLYPVDDLGFMMYNVFNEKKEFVGIFCFKDNSEVYYEEVCYSAA